MKCETSDVAGNLEDITYCAARKYDDIYRFMILVDISHIIRQMCNSYREGQNQF